MATKRKYLALFVVVIAVVTLLTYTEAGAVANGDGVCSTTEYANKDCAIFGTNVLEYRGARDGTCTRSDGEIFSCTYHFYMYTGISQNQLCLGIPTSLGTNVNDTLSTGCQQVVFDGGGDPTTGFLVNIKSLFLCRIPASVATPPVSDPPNPYNIWIATDPSQADPKNPLSWQFRYSSKIVYFDVINGPSVAAGIITTTGATITTSDGNSAWYELSGGQIASYSSNGRVVTLSDAKLCILNESPANNPPDFPDDWTCENLDYVTNECDIKTTGTDPCRAIGGKLLCY